MHDLNKVQGEYAYMVIQFEGVSLLLTEPASSKGLSNLPKNSQNFPSCETKLQRELDCLHDSVRMIVEMSGWCMKHYVYNILKLL